jgi:hypothetical protein
VKLKRQLAVVTVAKFAVAAFNVFFVYLCSVKLPPGEAATFFSHFSTVMLAAAFCGAGAGTVSFSIVAPAANRGAPFAREYSALLWLGLAAIATAASAYAVSLKLGWLQPVNPIGTGIFLVGAACTLLLADLNRSAGNVALPILLQGVAPLLIMPAALLVFEVTSADGLVTSAAVAFTLTAAAMFATGARNLTRMTAREVASYVRAALRASPLPAVTNMQVHAEIVLASQFLGPAALGAFVLANRAAALVRMPALIAFRVFAPSMDDTLAASLEYRGGDRRVGLRLFLAGAVLLAAGLAALVPASRLGLVSLPPDFYAYLAVCAGIKLFGLLPGSPESVLVARGRFWPIYGTTIATLVIVAAACVAAGSASQDNGLLIAGLVSLWFVLQKTAMLWSTQ